jgi:hypothetical protein
MLAALVGVLPARAGVAFKDAAFSGSATGTAIHTDALTSGETRVANAEVSLASAAVNSKGLATQAVNENGRVVNPALSSKQTYAKGEGLEVGLAGAPSADGQLILAGKAEANAAPTSHDNKEVGPVNADPVAFASAARGVADARWNTETCVLGEDLSRGLGYTADAQLVDTGADTSDDLDAPLVSTTSPTEPSNVVQTIARNYLVPNSKGDFGLRSEVDQILAPVNLANGIVIEVLGEWVLAATATGVPGESKVTYRPSKTDTGGPVVDTTPILRIIQPGANPGDDSITTVLDFQQVFGDAGFTLPANPLITLAIGEDPRAIGGDADSTPQISADGTTISAAADVVRITALDGAAADIRVGHMEVKAQVPSGGITCPIPVSKTATPNIVNQSTAPDGKFQVAITIKNAFACPLENVSATDDIIRKTGDVTFKIEDADPRNDPKKGSGATFTTRSTSSALASYPSLGTIAPGATKVINVVLSVTRGSGTIQDTATATGTLHCGPGSAIGEATAKLTGNFTLITTVVRVLARTGGEATMALVVATIAGLALVSRRILRTRRTS